MVDGGWRYSLRPEQERERRTLVDRLGPRLGGAALDDDPFLATSEVALLLRVSSATVRRWADAGKIASGRSLGGHRMFRMSVVRHALESIETGTFALDPQAI